MDLNTEEFISAVQDRTAIWQSKHRHHLNRTVINKLWGEIKQLFPGSDDKQLRKKWKNLRDHFRKEVKKYPPSRSGDSAENLQSTWPHFQQMLFCTDDITPEESFGNLNSVSSVSQDSSQDNSEDHTAEDVIRESSDGNTPSTSSGITQKRMGASDFRENFFEIESKKIKLLEMKLLANNSSNDDEKCEDYHFFKSIIPQLKEFPPLVKMRIKNKIMQMIMEETEKMEYERRFGSYGYGTNNINNDFNTTDF